MKAKGLEDYIKLYPQLYDWLYFNVINETPGDMSLLTDNINVLKRYIDGTAEKEYIFSIAMLASYDSGTSDININALQEADNFIKWIKEQNNKTIYPDFGIDCDVYSVEVLTEVPQLTINSENNIARYMITAKVNFAE